MFFFGPAVLAVFNPPVSCLDFVSVLVRRSFPCVQARKKDLASKPASVAAPSLDADQSHAWINAHARIMARYDWIHILSVATLAVTAGVVCVLFFAI